MGDKYSKEAEAIKILMQTLESLEEDIRKSVIEYVIKRFNINYAVPSLKQNLGTTQQEGLREATLELTTDSVDIRQLKEKKSPKSAIEMAVLAVYYLSHVVPQGERKVTVGPKDVTRCFEMAKFKLPSDTSITLTNAKNAGYLEQVKRGHYKLNAVGYNLIEHNLPRKGNK